MAQGSEESGLPGRVNLPIRLTNGPLVLARSTVPRLLAVCPGCQAVYIVAMALGAPWS
jgi:hypothetical protein